MKAVALESSTLAKVGYDRQQQLLAIEFRDGTVYRYFNVPAEVYEDLLQAPSKGRFFNQVLRGRFGYAQVSSLS